MRVNRLNMQFRYYHNRNATALVFCIAIIGCSTIYAADGATTSNLSPANAPPLLNFGQAVDIHDGVAVVGAPGDDRDGDSTGSAYVFKQNANGSWVFDTRIISSPVSVGATFGASVSVHGNTIVVGSPFDPLEGANAGASYIFQRQMNGQWTQIAQIVGSDTEGQDRFGTAVAVYENRIVVGASGHNLFGGAAYVFEQAPSGMWNEVQKLEGDNGGIFGGAVDIEGDRVVVGAAGEVGAAGPLTGAAHIFKRSSSGLWELEVKLIPDDIAILDRFGASVAIRGNVMVGGTACEVSEVNQCEAAYVFQLDAGTWQQNARLAAPINGFNRFGLSVATGCDIVMVGAPESDSACGGAPGCNAGAVHLFRRSGDSWLLAESFDGQADGDRFGSSVALFADSALVGIPSDDDACKALPVCNSGTARLIEALSPGSDCNENGISDDCDIANQRSIDANQNSIPDECDSAVPAAGHWGSIGLSILLIGAGITAWRRVESTRQHT